MSIHTCYLCYFGLREPLVQTQVLPYLRQLVEDGISVSLLTFEPQIHQQWTKEELTNEYTRLVSEGIRWFYRPYNKRPSIAATIYDIFAGASTVVHLARVHKFNVLHARSHVPLTIALLAQLRVRCRIVFDMRGLMGDEYVDAGIWRRDSLLFRLVKWLERVGLRRADQVVVLTQRMRDWLIQQELVSSEKLEVIPCCVDLSRFNKADIAVSTQNQFEVIYAGSITGLYLLEEMARFFLQFRSQRPDAVLRILTVSSTDNAARLLHQLGLASNDFWIGHVAPSDVPSYLCRAQLGISFRKPSFSQIAASPTKIAVYLAAGLPVVCNAGIGDIDKLLEKEKVGVILRSLNNEACVEGVEKALALLRDPELRARCKLVARRYFDITRVGKAGYQNLYDRLDAQIACKLRAQATQ